ncbi:hypothetical protein ACIPEQ_06710 [Curtobacterium sp. NPDC087080]|uniref:hypothetical protein n=1 Tax=unclassified Curtobacterium TaxID=257496 RepID=UPI00381FD4EB
MSALDAEIVAAQVAARKRLARLREKQRRDRARVDARVLTILRGKLRPADLAAVEAEARAQLDAEAAERSRRARDARQRRADS